MSTDGFSDNPGQADFSGLKEAQAPPSPFGPGIGQGGAPGGGLPSKNPPVGGPPPGGAGGGGVGGGGGGGGVPGGGAPGGGNAGGCNENCQVTNNGDGTLTVLLLASCIGGVPQWTRPLIVSVPPLGPGCTYGMVWSNNNGPGGKGNTTASSIDEVTAQICQAVAVPASVGVNCDNGGGGGGGGGGVGGGVGGGGGGGGDDGGGTCTFCGGGTTSNGTCPNCTININTQPIADAISDLANKLCKKTTDQCDLSDSCIDELVDKVIDKLNSEKKTCQQCCQELANGVALSAADQLFCNNCECDQCTTQCSLDGTTEGKCCNTCGQEPCCCNGAECVPCGPEDTSGKQTYHGWYNCKLGEFAATKNSLNPGPDWEYAGEYDTQVLAEQNAAGLMAKYCSVTSITEPTGGDVPQPNVADTCYINTYASPATRGALIQSFAGPKVIAGVIDSTNTFATRLLNSMPAQVVSLGLGGAIADTLTGPAIIGEALSPVIAGMMGCQDSNASSAVYTLTTIGLLNKLAGASFQEFLQPVYYAVHSSCRNVQLSTADAMSAWLAGSISDVDLDTHWAIRGYCPDAVKNAKFASKSKLIPDQLIQLLNRDSIPLGEFNQRMRNLGYVDADIINYVRELGQQVPPYSDIVRMMVRDADDQDLVNRFSLDTDFAKKYQGQLQAWAKAQGVPDKVMQYLWRAHWSIPSPGQLYEMYHRLRVPGQDNQPGSIYQDVVTALEQQDIAPYWIPNLLKVAFNPLTRVDTRRAYQLGAIDDDQLQQSYRNQGYDDDNVDILTKFTKKLKTATIRSEPAIRLWVSGLIDADACRQRLSDLGYSDSDISFGMSNASILFTQSAEAKSFLAGEIDRQELLADLQSRGVRGDDANRVADRLAPLVKYNFAVDQYEAGVITRDAAKAQMIQDGVDPDRADLFLSRVDGKLNITQVRVCTTAVRKRYVLGDISQDDAINFLKQQGITSERATWLVGKWQCELGSRGRQPSVNYLCSWLARGAIQPVDFVTRLQRLGYSQQDAGNILVDCLANISTKQAKQALAQAKQESAALARQQRLAARAAAAIERQNAALVTARKQRAAAIHRRQTLMMAIADKLYKVCSCSIQDATQAASNEVQYARTTYALDIDDALALVTKSVEAWDGVSLDSLRAGTDALGQALQDNQGELSESNDQYPIISNGSTQPS